MSIPLTPVEIEFLKRQAKVLRREEGISHSEALERLARSKSYASWALLMKGSGQEEAGPAVPRLLFHRSPEEVREALRKVPLPKWQTLSRSELARQQVPDLSRDFVDARNVIEYAISYMEALLMTPRFKVWSSSPVYWEMRAWLPYHLQAIGDQEPRLLVNREYKPAGETTKNWVKYQEWPNLLVRLEHADLAHVSRNAEGGLGYLFDDGTAPWRSREGAKRYLDRLRVFKSVLMGR